MTELWFPWKSRTPRGLPAISPPPNRLICRSEAGTLVLALPVSFSAPA